MVVTSGFRTDVVESLFPRGIPIGRVSEVDLDELDIYQRCTSSRSPTCAGSTSCRCSRASPVVSRRPSDRSVRIVPGTFLRVGLLLVLAVVLQLSALSQMTILGGQLRRGGARGRGNRLLRSSLSGCATASRPVSCSTCSAARRWALRRSCSPPSATASAASERCAIRPRLLPLAVGAAATGAWVVAFAAVSFMLDVGATVSPLVLREMVVTVLLNTLSRCRCSRSAGAAAARAGRRSPGGARPTPPTASPAARPAGRSDVPRQRAPPTSRRSWRSAWP